MDQCVIKVDTGFLYWDLMELYDLIKDSGNDNLKDYLPYIKNKLNEADKDSITDEIS